MKTAKPLLIAFLGLGLVLGATAQEKKVYRWVDKDGKVHISDQLPPEEVGRARKEYSASTGSLRNDVKTPLSPAEQAAAAEQARVEAAALAEAEKAKRIEQGMLTNYDNEQALQRAFNERTDLLKNTIVSLQASIQSRRAAVLPRYSVSCRPSLMRATARVTLRVTKFTPRRGDSWLNRMPLTANMSYASR